MTTIRGFLAVLGCAAALAFTGSAPSHAEKRVALVIGIDRYTNLTTLQKAGSDADAVGEILTRLGFEVIRGRDLGRQAMIDKIAEFTARIEAGDTVFFFFAGHGVAIGGVNYLVPGDAPAATAGAEARVRGASIAEGDVIAEIQAKGVRVAVLVLDACRDNPFPRAGTRTLGNTRGLADAKPARGVFTLYSAGIGQTALDRLGPNDRNRNSVFTMVFVEQLAKPGLHLGELAVEVREKVAEIALRARNEKDEPAPHEQTPAYYDQTIGGRVFLAGRTIGVQHAPPAAPPSQSLTAERERAVTMEEFRRELVGVPLCGRPTIGALVGKAVCTVHNRDGTAVITGAGVHIGGVWEIEGERVWRRGSSEPSERRSCVDYVRLGPNRFRNSSGTEFCIGPCP